MENKTKALIKARKVLERIKGDLSYLQDAHDLLEDMVSDISNFEKLADTKPLQKALLNMLHESADKAKCYLMDQTESYYYELELTTLIEIIATNGKQLERGAK